MENFIDECVHVEFYEGLPDQDTFALNNIANHTPVSKNLKRIQIILISTSIGMQKSSGV